MISLSFRNQSDQFFKRFDNASLIASGSSFPLKCENTEIFISKTCSFGFDESLVSN